MDLNESSLIRSRGHGEEELRTRPGWLSDSVVNVREGERLGAGRLMRVFARVRSRLDQSKGCYGTKCWTQERTTTACVFQNTLTVCIITEVRNMNGNILYEADETI